jgi:hypothetical protein
MKVVISALLRFNRTQTIPFDGKLVTMLYTEKTNLNYIVYFVIFGKFQFSYALNTKKFLSSILKKQQKGLRMHYNILRFPLKSI